jgi:hypothetical protein
MSSLLLMLYAAGLPQGCCPWVEDGTKNVGFDVPRFASIETKYAVSPTS